MLKKTIFLLGICGLAFGQSENEKHLKNIRQLTFGGNNAEAYFSRDDKKISFQSDFKEWGLECDQIFYMDVNSDTKNKKPKMISTGHGRTTCSFFMPNGKSVLYGSTHEKGGHACPMPPEMGKKYLWAVYETFDIYVSDLKGKVKKKLTDSPGYDAEAVVSPDGKSIVFTSTRNGDLDLYIMDIDGKNVRQITNVLGYDGGAFFSPDSKKLVFRASRFSSEAEKEEYKENLKKNLVAPTNMEIFTINVDGTDLRQITNLGKANWAPYFTPKADKIIFASNHHSARGYDFQLYMINIDGTGLTKITTESNFNAFPMFSYDGKKLIFSSNRNNGGTRDTNLFIADWVD
jgi:Tol biopolymer transport system component